jgi:uracil-DNA glycosylase
MPTGDLERLLTEIRACRRCVEAPTGSPLPHEPRPVLQAGETARLAIYGQAPGARAHASGRPFSDPSGDRLRGWLGLEPEVFYDASRVALIPMGFCYPGTDRRGADRPPRRECAPFWRDRVLTQLANLRTHILLGGYAQAWHLPQRMGSTLSESVARWRDVAPEMFPLPHPSWRNNAWLQRHPWFEAELLPALRQRVRELVL